MDMGSILLILALLVFVGVFVGRPLLETRSLATASDRSAETADHERSTLMAERDRILNALQELDFDNMLGKIPAEDYPQQRAALLQRGADILRQLDEIEAEGSEEDPAARIEAAIAARRADTGGAPPETSAHLIADPDDDLEVLLANRRRTRQEKSAGFCHKCGGPVQKSDRFCPKCGANLS